MTTLTEVASGVDSLYLSGRSVLEPELLDELEAGRVDAQQTGSPTQIWFGGYAWDLQPRSLNRYRFRLDHPLVTLGITPSQNLPTLYAQCRSEGIHSLGAQGVVNWLHGVLDNVGIARACTVSRIDVHADWQGWTLTGDERSRFVCRAKDLTTYENDLELTGFSFGNRHSGTLTARIYDKTEEIGLTGHDWWIDLWGDRFDPDRPVLRTEFEFARNALREMNLRDPDETLARVGDLWAYATQKWLTYRTPTRHGCTNPWPVAPEWQQIQQASLAGAAVPIDRITAGRQRGALRKMMPALNGYVASFGAWTDNDSIDDACSALPEHLRSYEHFSQRAFCSRVHEKRQQQ